MRSRFVLSSILLFAFTSSLPARADNTADEADLRFRRGITAWNARLYEDALGEFFQSNRLVRNRNVLLNIARCYEQLKRLEEAHRYYEDVLAENPPAEDRAVVEEALGRLSPRLALLRVESDPPGAEVFIDRRDLGSRGTTPRTLALPPGAAQVLLSLDGHRDASKPAQLVTGRTTVVTIPLEFVWGRVVVVGTPPQAQVRLDTLEGPPLGRVSDELKVPPGKHILNVSAPGFVTMQVPVDVKPDGEEWPTVALQRLPDPTGALNVIASHEGALVKVDGKEVGTTPAYLNVAVGKHEVEVSLEEMHTVTRTVNVTASGKAEVKVALQYAGARTTAGSKTETTLDEAPASITVISREEIQAFGYTTVAEALRAVRGMFLSRDRTYEFLGVRGFSPPGDYNQRVLILYDGHPMNDLFSGQAYVGRENNVDLNEVERIEVVRGPVSALFGTTAFFGVINIVPRHTLGDHKVEAEVATGSLGLARGRTTAGVHDKDTEVLVTAAGVRELDEGLYVGPADEGEPVVRGRATEQAANASARLRYKALSLLASVNDRTKDYLWLTRTAAPLATRYARSTGDRRAFVEGRFELEGTGGSGVLARAYYDATRYAALVDYDDGTGRRARGDADWAGLELRWRSAEFLSQHLSVGAEFQRQLQIVQQNWTILSAGASPFLQLDDTRAFNVGSAWLSDELKLGSLFLLNAAVRADYYFESFGLTVNPRLALITHAIPGGTTKLIAGRSFRSPTAYERFYSDPIRDLATGELTGQYGSSRPSPDLLPETVISGELEHAHELAPGLRLTGSIYVNSLSNLVYSTRDADGLALSVNATGTVRTQGAELELRWRPTRWGLVTAAWWWQQLVSTGLDADQAQRLQANIPPNAFSLKAALPISAPLLIGSVEAVYNAPRAKGDGSGADGEVTWLAVGLSGELPGKSLRYYLGVRNLLNARSEWPSTLVGWGAQPAGTSVLAQVVASY